MGLDGRFTSSTPASASNSRDPTRGAEMGSARCTLIGRNTRSEAPLGIRSTSPVLSACSNYGLATSCTSTSHSSTYPFRSAHSCSRSTTSSTTSTTTTPPKTAGRNIAQPVAHLERAFSTSETSPQARTRSGSTPCATALCTS